MKKILTGILLIILASTMIIANGVSLNNRDETIKLTTDEKTTLASIGIDNPVADELICKDGTCRTCLHDTDPVTNESVGAGCISFSDNKCTKTNETDGSCITNVLLTTEEKNTELSSQIKTKLEFIASVTKTRQAISAEVKSGEQVTITISDK